jgi:branched-chain amino acid transport system substrate-binding protein
VASQDELFSNETADSVTKKLTNAKYEGVVTEKIGAGDPAAVANRIVKVKPAVQAVVIVAAPGPATAMAKALRAGGFEGRLMFGSASADSLFLTGESGGILNGAALVFTPTFVSDDIIATSPAKSNRVAWFQDYLSTFGTYNAYASFAADAVGVVVKAIGQINSTDRDNLRTAIETTTLDGLSGPIRITPANHSGLMPQAVTLLVAANGRWRLAS